MINTNTHVFLIHRISNTDRISPMPNTCGKYPLGIIDSRSMSERCKNSRADHQKGSASKTQLEKKNMENTRGQTFMVGEPPQTKSEWRDWLTTRLEAPLWGDAVVALMSHEFAGPKQQRCVLDACNRPSRRSLLEVALDLAHTGALMGFVLCPVLEQAWQHEQTSV